MYGNFLGNEDEWKDKKVMTFLSKEEVLRYFEDFKITYYAEKKCKLKHEYIKSAL